MPACAFTLEKQKKIDRRMFKTTNTAIRVVERGGRKLKDVLGGGDPWEGARCERDGCLPCKGRDEDRVGISCQKENVTYTIRCTECAKGGITAIYWGETARNGFKRGGEHCEGLYKELEKAPLWRHARMFHEGQKNVDWYRMKVERSHRTPLVRQLDEGVEIATCKAAVVMNSKGEWNGSKLPKMVIERG